MAETAEPKLSIKQMKESIREAGLPTADLLERAGTARPRGHPGQAPVESGRVSSVGPPSHKILCTTRLKLNTNKNNTPRAWEVLSEDVVEREEDEQHRRGRVDVREVRRAADDRVQIRLGEAIVEREPHDRRPLTL